VQPATSSNDIFPTRPRCTHGVAVGCRQVFGRLYDASRIQRLLGFRCATDFGFVLEALRTDDRLPFAHQPA
jgi:UDP-glucose 4-epimerase